MRKLAAGILTRVRKIFNLAFWVGFAVLFLLLAVRVVDPGFVQTLRYQSFDFYQRSKPREFQNVPVRIIDLDENSLAKYGQWPWPRTLIAELINKLKASGAVVIGFDIIFAEPDRLSPPRIAEDNPNLPQEIRDALNAMPQNEEVMAKAMATARVVTGQTSVRNLTDAGVREQEIAPIPHAALGGDPDPYLEHYPDLVQNLPELESFAKGQGVFSISPDLDGVFRRIPMVVKVKDKLRLTLVAEMLRVGTGGKAFATKVNRAGIEGIVVGGKLVQTDRNARVWPYFTEPNSIRYVSAGDILDGTANKKLVAGHLVLVGTSAVGLGDIRVSPIASAIPGVEIHTQLLESILSGKTLIRPNYALGMELLFLAITGLIIILLVPNLGAIWSLLFAVIALSAYGGFSYYMFSEKRVLLDATYPIGAASLLMVLLIAGNYIREERQRQQIKGAFGQYLSPDLVDQIVDDPDRLVLGGETKELSVLFSDVRGFTSISEAYKDDPQGLTKLMNQFLTVLTNAILKRGGTIDKYMGDAVMAFWNAPLDTKNHALQSCRAALDMMSAINELNAQRDEEYRAQGKEAVPINVGIGINTGDCVVGNMGSDMRFDYTALADTVNIASRLEGQSKPFGMAIVIGSNTAEEAKDELAIIEIDYIQVKGKQEPERVFALLGDENLASDEQFKQIEKYNNSMLKAYREQKWDTAQEAIFSLSHASEDAGIDMSVYLDLYTWRIEEFIENPPGVHWDGVYVATSK